MVSLNQGPTDWAKVDLRILLEDYLDLRRALLYQIPNADDYLILTWG